MFLYWILNFPPEYGAFNSIYHLILKNIAVWTCTGVHYLIICLLTSPPIPKNCYLDLFSIQVGKTTNFCTCRFRNVPKLLDFQIDIFSSFFQSTTWMVFQYAILCSQNLPRRNMFFWSQNAECHFSANMLKFYKISQVTKLN